MVVLCGQAVGGSTYHLAGNSFQASRRGGELMFMAAGLRKSIHSSSEECWPRPGRGPRLGDSSSAESFEWETSTGLNLAGEPSEL